MSSQLTLGVRLRDSSVFASYFSGRNLPVVDALRRIQPLLPTSWYLHGAAGTGKSHLLQAVCAAASEQGIRAAYLPLSDISRSGPDVLSGWGDLDVVCVDDIDTVATLRDWNLALFSLHRQLEEHRGRLLVASQSAPLALQMTLADLASRFAGGLVLTLQNLEEPEQIHALQLHAELRGFELPVDTAQYMLRRLPRDMSTLCAFLDRLDEASLVAQRRLTVPFVRQVMEQTV